MFRETYQAKFIGRMKIFLNHMRNTIALRLMQGNWQQNCKLNVNIIIPDIRR